MPLHSLGPEVPGESLVVSRIIDASMEAHMRSGSLLAAVVIAAPMFMLTPLADSQQTFRVGSAAANSGTKATGFLDVPAGTDAGTRIPVVVVQGENRGPVLTLASGSHGTEYASILAVEQLIEKLDPKRLSGTVIALPLINTASFEQKVPHINPVDGKSMNRFYPGKADGTQTERTSSIITHEVVDKSDYLIDFHGGDLDENLRPYAYWSPVGNSKQDATSRGMVEAFGLDTIILVTERPKDPNAARYLDNNASLRGKPSIAVEAGYAGTSDPADIALLVDGTLNVMRYLKMLPGDAIPIEHPVWVEKIHEVTSSETGIFYPLVKRGSYVAAGAKLGYVTDYFGHQILEPRAPAAGVVLYICAVPSMKKGNTVAYVGQVAAQAP
jgi:predicted deacylase